MEAGKADVERRWPFFAPDPALGNKVGREHNEITRRGRTNKRDNTKKRAGCLSDPSHKGRVGGATDILLRIETTIFLPFELAGLFRLSCFLRGPS